MHPTTRASLSRRLSILAASIRVTGRFPSFRVLPSAIGKRGAVGRFLRPDVSKYWSRSSSSLWMLLDGCRRTRVLFDVCRHRDRFNILQIAEAGALLLQTV